MKKLLLFLGFLFSSLFAENVLYFNYDLAKLSETPASDYRIDRESLIKWDDLVYQLNSEFNLENGGNQRFVAYLYLGQKEAAFISKQLTGDFKGSLAPLNQKIIHLFFPKYQQTFAQSDPYSETLANIVFQKLLTRFELEEKQLKDYPAKTGPHYWSADPPVVGRKVGSCLPWFLNNIAQYRLPPPPDYNSIIWTYGLMKIKEAQDNLTPEKINLIKFWAGMEGPKSGNWIAMANDYMAKQQLSLEHFLMIRANYAMGLVDTSIACFDTKYSYWVIRPIQRDPHLKIIIPTPKHPSYPSGHSVYSSSAAKILSYYFPENAAEWRFQAIQAGETRIWAGLHYILDHVNGLIFGEHLGELVLNKIEENDVR